MTINRKITFLDVRRFAGEVLNDLAAVSQERDEIRATLSRIGGLSQLEREKALENLNSEIASSTSAWQAQLVEFDARRSQHIAQLD